MKIALLCAGVGKRMGALGEKSHKTLIPLLGKPLLGHLIERLLYNGLTELIMIVGHQKERVLDYVRKNYGEKLSLTVVENPKYAQANNMYSMWCARHELKDKEFLLCNGDVVVNKFIIKDLLEKDGQSVIAVDDGRKEEEIDSPRVLLRDGRIADLSRTISPNVFGGYAIGLYKFNRELSLGYYDRIEEMLKEGHFSAGFQDPFVELFKKHPVFSLSTQGRSWGDVDTQDDIRPVEEILKRIMLEERN